MSTDKKSHTSISATRRALENPLILNRVLEWILLDTRRFKDFKHYDAAVENGRSLRKVMKSRPSYGSRGVLRRCSRVNKHWFAESTRVLWRHPMREYRSTVACLQNVSPARRQFYANHIESAFEYTLSSTNDTTEFEELLEGLRFPRLTELKLMLSGGGSDYIFPIRDHAIKVISLNPQFSWDVGLYYVKQPLMDRLLQRIEELFPSVETIRFLDRGLAYPGTMERFQQRMGKLKEFQHDLVMESDDLDLRATLV